MDLSSLFRVKMKNNDLEGERVNAEEGGGERKGNEKNAK